MKILFITDFLPPYTNGIAIYSANTIRCLKKAGCKVTTFGPKGSPIVEHELPTLNLSRYLSIETGICFPNWKLIKTLLFDRYDAIHINCPQGSSGFLICILSIFKKYNVFYFNHGNITDWFNHNIKNLFFRKLITKFFVSFYYLPQRLFSPVIVQNPGCNDLSLHFKREFRLVEGGCGVDLELFSPSLSYEKYHLVSIGRLSNEKNWMHLISLFAQLPCYYRLTIIGTGQQEKELKEVCRRLKLDNVFFTGKISQGEVCSYLQKAQACITASLAETWGLTLIEGLSCGTPPIYPNHSPFIGLYAQSFPHGSYEPEDPQTFVTAVLQTETTTAEDRKKYHDFSRKFSWENATKQLIEIYRDFAS